MQEAGANAVTVGRVVSVTANGIDPARFALACGERSRTTPAPAVRVYAPPGTADPAELFHVDVDDLARARPFIAVGGFVRLQPRQLAEPIQQLGERAGLAEIFRLRVLERRRIVAGLEVPQR